AHVEDDLTEGGSAGIVEVYHRLLSACASFHSLANKVFTRLCQNDDGDVVGDPFFVYQLAHEVEVGLRRGGKTDFDFLETDLDELFEQTQLALHAHGFDQRLVAVAQIGAHPDGWLGDAFAGPGSFGKIAFKGDERTIFFSGIGDHDAPV